MGVKFIRRGVNARKMALNADGVASMLKDVWLANECA